MELSSLFGDIKTWNLFLYSTRENHTGTGRSDPSSSLSSMMIGAKRHLMAGDRLSAVAIGILR